MTYSIALMGSQLKVQGDFRLSGADEWFIYDHFTSIILLATIPYMYTTGVFFYMKVSIIIFTLLSLVMK